MLRQSARSPQHRHALGTTTSLALAHAHPPPLPLPLPRPPLQMRDFFVFADGDSERYLPMITFDEFWLLRDKLVPMNETVDEVPLHLLIKTGSIWWMQLQQQARSRPRLCMCKGRRAPEGGGAAPPLPCRAAAHAPAALAQTLRGDGLQT